MPTALPYTEESYRLLHDGTIALARVEANGIRVDEGYIGKALRRNDKKIARLQEELDESEVMQVWRKRFKTRTNTNSTEQLGKVLFESMGFKDGGKTASGKRYKTDEDTLALIDHPFITAYFEIKKLVKGGQFLTNIQRQTCEGFLHPSFSLNIAITFRSTSDSPNFQNLPNRDEIMRELVRQCIVARPSHRIVELDFKGIEVGVSCCYNEDPRLKKYILDKSKDMHRDMAMECYMLEAEQVTKEIRHCGKNMFVFPQFYGSWYLDCAGSLWRAMTVDKLVTADGVPLKKHLRRQGIKELGDQDREHPDPRPGTFEAHIQAVEKDFWNSRFKVYKKWRQEWYAEYLEQGWFQSKTGFIYQGHMARNDVINYAVQGSAFHCLLWCLIQLVNKRLKEAGLRAKIIGQIHDSIVADVPEEEVAEFIALCKQIMAKELREHWGWITVPMDIEVEVGPVGGSWAHKEKWEEN